MMKKFIYSISLMILLVPQLASAWTGNQKILELYVHTNVVLVKLAVDPVSTCADNTYLTLEPRLSPLFNEMYAMLLAAKMANKAVDVNISGCGIIRSTHPRIGYVRIL